MKRKLDIMSFLGILFGFVLMVIGIILTKDLETQAYSINMINMLNFYDPTSIAIVLGGTFTALMIAFPLSQFKKIFKHLKIIFSPREYVPAVYIETLVECAKKARIKGLLALEEDIQRLDNAFMKSSLMMVLDSVDPEKVTQQVNAWLDNLDERHAQDRAFYDKGAAFAPAFGMIGTLIGLINMLKSLNDIESVGPNMAVALITTFYGTILSNLFFIPISNKLRVRHEEEYLCMRIIADGVIAIQAGENPNFIQDHLIHLLPEYSQKKYRREMGLDEGNRSKGRK